MSQSFLFTSESVSEGHPDKISDQISDAILDAILKEDSSARVACETMVKTGMVVVAGEITTSAWVDFEKIARRTIVDIGYTDSDMGFDGHTCAVLSAIGEQSGDIDWFGARRKYARTEPCRGFVRTPRARLRSCMRTTSPSPSMPSCCRRSMTPM